MNQLTKKVMLGQPLELVYPRNFVFYADLWHPEQLGFGTLANGTGIATPTALVAGANTVTVTQAGTFVIWLPSIHTGTAASGTATVTGSPVSLVGGNNTITVVGTGTITITCTDQVVDRSTNALLCSVTGSPTWSNQGRTLNGTTQYLTTPHSSALDFERTDKFALAAWVKTASAGNGNSILSKQLNSGNYNGYTMELANSGKLYMNLINDVSPSQYTSVSSTNSVNDDEWHFILAQNKALAGGAGSDIEIFIDAVQETPVIAVDTLGSNSILTTTSLDIGARTGGQLIAATIGEVWVYSGTFSLPGVIQLRNATRWRYV